jgi:hypothetical protein
VQDQWQKKKQTREQKHAARLAKLDPDNWRSAKDVVDDRAAAAAALKRKRDENADEDSNEDDDGDNSNLDLSVEKEQPKPKKRKTESQEKKKPTTEESSEDKRRRIAEERAAKREKKKLRKAKAKEKLERQKAKKREAKGQVDNERSQSRKKDTSDELHLQIPVDLGSARLQEAEHTRAQLDGPTSPSSATSEEEPEEVFSPQHESGTSSTSSILPPAALDDSVTSEPPKPLPLTNTNIDTTKDPHQRLQEALAQFRASRKADTSEPKSRQELLDQRRRKEEARKAAKKEQKRREKEEEARRQDEEIARRFSPGGSGSLLASPRSPVTSDNGASSSNNFTFGRIAFADGTNFDPSINDSTDGHSKKGPRDAASQLHLAQSKKLRLAGLDEEKRAQIEQKDLWLNAKKRAHGQHVRDDTSLLKKALKRQQTQKKKSEKEWGERLEGVKKAQELKQKKRMDNLDKRKEEKRAGAGGGKPKKVRRPGFEGSFKGRTGGGKKKS